MRNRWIRSLSAVFALGSAASAAMAQDPGKTEFGEDGVWAFSTDAAIDIRHRTQAEGPSTTAVTLLPAADYFIIDNLSLGGVIGVKYSKTGDNNTVDFQLGPRVGYDFELGDRFSIWPKLGVFYAHSDFKDDEGGSDANNAVQLNLFVPFMFHPAVHFFAGFGPFLESDLSGNNRVTQWGLKLTLGGWV